VGLLKKEVARRQMGDRRRFTPAFQVGLWEEVLPEAALTFDGSGLRITRPGYASIGQRSRSTPGGGGFEIVELSMKHRR